MIPPGAYLPTLPENSLEVPRGAPLAPDVVLFALAHMPDGTVGLALVDRRTIAIQLWCNMLELVSIRGQNAGKADRDIVDRLCNPNPGAGVLGIRSKIYDEQEPL